MGRVPGEGARYRGPVPVVPVRDDLRALEGYHSPQVRVRVRLNTNESPTPPPAAWRDAFAAELSRVQWHRYPDRAAAELRAAIAGLHGVDPAQIFVANGSNEVLQTLLLTALSVAREREQGTFDQLLVTPLKPLQILIGKALPPMVVGVFQSTLIFLIILFWFQIPMVGSVWLLYLALTMFTLASVGIGLSISAVSLSMQQAMLYTFMLTMPLMLLSGLLTPVRNMPLALQIATYVNPLRFGVDLVRRVYLEGAGFGDVAFNFVPLLAVAAVTLPLAAWLFRHRLA